MRIVVAVVAAVVVQYLLADAPTAAAGVALVLASFAVGRLVGRHRAVAAGLFACYVFGDHHLADAHGVLGTDSVAITFLSFQVTAIVAGELGHRWRRRADLDAVLAELGVEGRSSTPGALP